MAKITLIGLEQFLNPDSSIFDNMQLPEGIDKETLVGTILMRCNEFEVLYPDPEFMKTAVYIWSKKHYWTFNKWITVMNKEYEPLWNKDYTEEMTDEHSGEYSKEGSGSASGNSSSSSDYTRTDNISTTNDATQTHSEAAFNSSDLEEKTKDVIDQDGTQTGTVRNAGSDSQQFGNTNSTDESGDDSYTNTHNYHGYGNIGIMSSQQLFRDEISTTSWSIYEAIADLFCQEFCIMVY